MDTSKIVGEKIKSLRENQSISVEELAERSGLAVEQIERIENNIDLPSLAPLIKIARVLGVRLGTFLDDQDEMGPVVCRKSEATDCISFSNNAIQSRSSWSWKELWKSATGKTPICWKKVTQSTMIPLYHITYMPTRDKLPRFWPSSILRYKMCGRMYRNRKERIYSYFQVRITWVSADKLIPQLVIRT